MLDRVEALERLARLHASGALSDDEFAVEKKRILDGAQNTPAPQTSPPKSDPGAVALGEQSVSASAALAMPVVSAEARGSASASWRARLARHRWAVGGLAAALVIGGILAWAILLDLNDAAAPSKRRQSAGRTEAAAKAKADAPPAEGGAEAIAEGADLAALFRFEAPAKCGLGSNLRLLTDALAARQPSEAQGAAIDVAGAGAPVVPRVEQLAVDGGDSAPVIAQVDIVGSWNGLNVRGVRTVTWPASRVASIQVRFSDPPEQVRQVLNGNGFELPAAGELRNARGSDGQPLAIGVEAVSGGSALTCIRGTSAAARGA